MSGKILQEAMQIKRLKDFAVGANQPSLFSFLRDWLEFRDQLYSKYGSIAMFDPIAQIWVDERPGTDLASVPDERGAGAVFSVEALKTLGNTPSRRPGTPSYRETNWDRADSVGFLFIAAHEVFHDWRLHDLVEAQLTPLLGKVMAEQLVEFDADLMAVAACYRFLTSQLTEILDTDARVMVWMCIHAPFRVIVRSTKLNDCHPGWPTRAICMIRKLSSIGSPVGAINSNFHERLILAFVESEIELQERGDAPDTIADFSAALLRQEFEHRSYELERIYEKYRYVFDDACCLTEHRLLAKENPEALFGKRMGNAMAYACMKPDS